MPCFDSGVHSCDCSDVLDSQSECGFAYFSSLADLYVPDNVFRTQPAENDNYLFPANEIYLNWWNDASVVLDCAATLPYNETLFECPASAVSNTCDSCNSAKQSAILEGGFAVAGGSILTLATLMQFLLKFWTMKRKQRKGVIERLSTGSTLSQNPYAKTKKTNL